MVLTWGAAILAGGGAVAAALGLMLFAKDGRRIGALGCGVLGTFTALVSGAILLFQQGFQGPLLVIAIAALAIMLLGTIVGYPVLVLFLLWSGVTVLRRESRSLSNGLALLAGVGMVVLPFTLRALEPAGAMQESVWYITRYGMHSAAVLVVGYVAVVFAIFLIASLLYRWRRLRIMPEAVIILGAGLIDGQVPPLLQGRLRRGLEVQRSFDPAPVIITSGGQGADEPRAEGVAMREYLIAIGAEPEGVIAETESRSTRENLYFSQQLLTDPHAAVVVVTSNYHVFRAALLTRSMELRAHVVGSKTAWYYLPSAVLREFAGVVRDQLRIHLSIVGALVVLGLVSSFLLVPAMIPPPGT